MTAQLVDRPIGASEAEWAEIVDALTRREFLTGSAGAAVLGLGLAGHGVPSAAAAPATRVVDTAGGKVTDPTRVVCIDYFTAIFLLELSLTPIGGIDYSGVDDFTMYPAYIAALTKLANIGQITSTNYEKVAALHPDLILGPTPGSRYDNSKGAMKTLGAVAPVASVNFGNTGDWRAPFAQAANIVNRAGRRRPHPVHLPVGAGRRHRPHHHLQPLPQEHPMTTMPLDSPASISEAEWAEIVDALTRREFLVGGAATALGMGLCGWATLTPAADAATDATRVVDTPKGEVRVPADPKRVVAIQPSPMSTLYDLGVKVVGVYDEGAEYVSPRYRPHYDAAPKVGTGGQVNVEKVAVLHPDLIVGANYSWNSDVYGQLSEIAPTVLTPVNGTWETIAAATADAVNRTGALARFERRLAHRSAQIKATYADVLAKYRWDILQGGFDQGQYWLYGPGSDIGKILAGAGVRYATGSAKTPGNANRSLSYEDIDVLGDAGVIGFYANYNDTPNNQGPQLFAQAGFKALPAVKARRMVPIPDFLPGGYGDALAALDELETGLKKLKGGKS